MYIKKVHIENFKKFHKSFDIEFNQGINIVVGDNESGKSTIIEAIYLALTGLYNCRNIKNELTQFIWLTCKLPWDNLIRVYLQR